MAKKYFKKQEKKRNNPKLYPDGHIKPTGLNPYVTPRFHIPDDELPSQEEMSDAMARVMLDISDQSRMDEAARDVMLRSNLDRDRFKLAEP